MATEERMEEEAHGETELKCIAVEEAAGDVSEREPDDAEPEVGEDEGGASEEIGDEADGAALLVSVATVSVRSCLGTALIP